jgi:hypothetical protein
LPSRKRAGELAVKLWRDWMVSYPRSQRFKELTFDDRHTHTIGKFFKPGVKEFIYSHYPRSMKGS